MHELKATTYRNSTNLTPPKCARPPVNVCMSSLIFISVRILHSGFTCDACLLFRSCQYTLLSSLGVTPIPCREGSTAARPGMRKFREKH